MLDKDKLIYNGDPELIHSPQKKIMDRFIIQGMAGTSFGIIVTGLNFSGYLIFMGASDELVSYVTILPGICSIFLVFFSALIDRFERRRLLTVVFGAIGRCFMVSTALVPMFAEHPYRVPLIFILYMLGHATNMVSGIGFNTWFNGLIPAEIRGRYFSARQVCSMSVSLILPLLCGLLIDHVADKYIAYLILFTCAGVMIVIEMRLMLKIPEHKTARMPGNGKLLSLLRVPLRNKSFLSFTAIVVLFNFIYQLAATFNSLYLLRYLQVSMTFVNGVTPIAALLQLLIFYKFWGRITDRLGARFSLAFCICFHILDLMLWFFIKPSTVHVLLIISQMCVAVHTAGLNVSLYKRRYDIIPVEGRAVYDAVYLSVTGIVLLLSPIAGRFLRGTLEERVPNMEFGSFRLMYLISAFLLLILQVFHVRGALKSEDNKDLVGKQGFRRLITTIKECLF